MYEIPEDRNLSEIELTLVQSIDGLSTPVALPEPAWLIPFPGPALR